MFTRISSALPMTALALTMLAAHADAAGLLIADGGFGGVLEIKQHDVHVTVNNGVAVTEVEQVFLNTEDRIVEALYTFPVPKDASVANFSMWIGGKEMIGEVVEKERARRIYESYKQTRRAPGLLEQVDYKTFELRIFPIPANAEQRIKVTYYQELDFDHDWASYVYPLATVTRENIDQKTSGRFSFALHAKSETSITKIDSPSHDEDLVTVQHGANYVQASLETREGDLSRDLVVSYRVARPRTGVDLIASKAKGEDGYFMLTLTAGQELAELSSGMDYVFVLDISGSMAHDGKLALSQESLLAFVKSLGERDRYEMMAFNVAPQSLFGKLTGVSEESRSQASGFLRSQRAAGGTALRPALTAAYRYQDPDRPLNVVVLSDGMTEQNEQRELLGMIEQRPPGSRLFCIGVGNEANKPLLAQLAEGAGGLAAFISREDDFQRQAEAFRRKLIRPAMRDIRLNFQGGGVYDVEPKALPDLFHGSPVRVYGRYRDAGKMSLQLQADVQGAIIDQTLQFELPQQEAGNPQIERMWALRRVRRLLDEERASAVSHQQPIVRLCEEYSIVSPYASFIVLENDAEYARWKIERRNAARLEADRAARRQVNEQLRQLRERAMTDLGPRPSEQIARGPQAEPAAPHARNRPEQPSRSSTDIAMPSMGGGGAIDPLSGSLALALAGAAAAAARRRKRKSPVQPR